IRRQKLPDGMIICTFTDVTNQAKAEEEVQRQRETLYQREKLSALGMLLAGVAHELNNPLSVVLGQAQMLQIEFTEPA
ncbi:MAG: hybrid sensor histidine kinase/response regulator, partial [Candidatus Competibacteraceae bacterium]|nr:hybrid sensor histidine kinase/response regulator [Candidatus Competibacteraceae bacterium]